MLDLETSRRPPNLDLDLKGTLVQLHCQLFLLVLELSERLWQGNPACRTWAGQELVDRKPTPALLQLLQQERRPLAALINTQPGLQSRACNHVESS